MVDPLPENTVPAARYLAARAAVPAWPSPAKIDPRVSARLAVPIFDPGRNRGLIELARPCEDLTDDEFIVRARREEVSGRIVPVLGGAYLLCKIGQGGMGAVYYGIKSDTLQEVAVKVLPFHLEKSDPNMIKRFFREAKIAGKIDSENLVRVLDINREGKLSYLFMDYIHGKSGDEILALVRRGGAQGLDEITALDLCIAGCKGLAAAHAENVIHRDVKPDNIMIPRNRVTNEFEFERSKLTDLGLARCDDMHMTVTRSHAPLGTPGYTAPEQIADAHHAGKPADVFAMGATLYELLAGGVAFTGASTKAIWNTTAQEPHVPVRTHRKEISKPTAETIDICLAKDPECRYADGAALLKALETCRALISDSHAADYALVTKPRLSREIELRAASQPAVVAHNPARATETLPRSERHLRPVVVPREMSRLRVAALAFLAVLTSGIVYVLATRDTGATPSVTAAISLDEMDRSDAALDRRAAEQARVAAHDRDKIEVKNRAAVPASAAPRPEDAARVEFENILVMARAALAGGDSERADVLMEAASTHSGRTVFGSGAKFDALKCELAAQRLAEANAKRGKLLAELERLSGREAIDQFGRNAWLTPVDRSEARNTIDVLTSENSTSPEILRRFGDALGTDAEIDLGGGCKIELVLVPAGNFTMGSAVWTAGSGAEHEHSVRISEPFYLTKYPISTAQFRRFVEAEHYVTEAEQERPDGEKGAVALRRGKRIFLPGTTWRNPGFEQQENSPVVTLSWADSARFAQWLSKKIGAAATLPTEAQWEYAARGPSGTHWAWGNDWSGAKCNHADITLKLSAIAPEGAPCTGGLRRLHLFVAVRALQERELVRRV